MVGEGAELAADPQPERVASALPAAGPEECASLEFEVRRLDQVVRRFRATAGPTNDDHLRSLLAATVRRDGRDPSEIGDYELEVWRPDGEEGTAFAAVDL